MQSNGLCISRIDIASIQAITKKRDIAVPLLTSRHISQRFQTETAPTLAVRRVTIERAVRATTTAIMKITMLAGSGTGTVGLLGVPGPVTGVPGVVGVTGGTITDTGGVTTGITGFVPGGFSVVLVMTFFEPPPPPVNPPIRPPNPPNATAPPPRAATPVPRETATSAGRHIYRHQDRPQHASRSHTGSARRHLSGRYEHIYDAVYDEYAQPRDAPHICGA
jgi:hypothetical protein